MTTDSSSFVFPPAPYPWQMAHWDRLLQRMQVHSFPHAILLTGKKGVGQVQFATALALFLLCEAPQKKACGRCASCELVAAGTHPDYERVAPEKAGAILKIDQIRALTPLLAQRAFKGGRKIVVIESAETLNTASSNALLKQLEEPHADTVFIMVTDDVDRLLPTVVSRCHRIRFYASRTPEVEAWLSAYLPKGVETSIDALWRAYFTPLAIIDAMLSGLEEKRRAFFQALGSLQSSFALMSACEDIPQTALLSWMMLLVQDCIRIKMNQAPRFIDRPLHKKLQASIAVMNIPDCYQVLALYAERKKDGNQQVSLHASLFAFSIVIPWLRLLAAQPVQVLEGALS